MMTLRSIRVVCAIVLVAGSALAAGMSSRAVSAATCQSWDTRPRTASNYDHYLTSVAMTGACNVFLVGGYRAGSSSGPPSVLIEHWDGRAWRIQPGINPATDGDWLSGVATTSASNAWAVGWQGDGSDDRTLIERWNGISWQLVGTPNVGTHLNDLNAVAAASTANAWAVGESFDGTHYHTLIEHWAGTSWRVVPSPNAGTDDYLWAVAVGSATDAWAVGNYSDAGSVRHTLALHWNGLLWKVVTSPNRGALANALTGVAFSSPNRAWAVGYNTSPSSGFERTLVERWNGSAWKIVASPTPWPGSDNELHAVAATSPANAWAVGNSMEPNGHTMVEHWDGISWSVEPSADQAGADSNDLNGVAAASTSDAWAVGEFSTSSGYFPLALHCC
jgi:hypothetical protein